MGIWAAGTSSHHTLLDSDLWLYVRARARARVCVCVCVCVLCAQVQEEEHNHTVHLYRQYILAAAQGRLRPEMHQLLSQIAEARQVEGE